MPDLTPSERTLLDFEDAHPKHTGAKEERIRVDLKMTSARYYQRVYTLLHRPDVVADFPQLVHRTTRVLESQRERRRGVSRLRRAA